MPSARALLNLIYWWLIENKEAKEIDEFNALLEEEPPTPLSKAEQEQERQDRLRAQILAMGGAVG